MSFITLGKLQSSGSLEGSLTHIEQTRDYAMLAGRLYKKGVDGIQRLCIEPEDADVYMQRAHVAMGNIHFADDLRIRHAELMGGIYWRSMQKDIFAMVQACGYQKDKGNFGNNALALYHVNTIASKWVESIVEFLTTETFLEKMGKLRQRYLHKQAQDYCIIANQVYHRGKDGCLRMFVLGSEYVPIMGHAHACIPSGHFSADVKTKEIMRAGLWWPILFQDAAMFVKGCDVSSYKER